MDIPAMLLYMAVTGVTPGPHNLMTLYLCAQHGFRGARKFIVGSTIGFFLKLLLCGALNVALAAIVPALVPYLKWLGAAYMLYLAFTMLRSGFAAPGEEKEKTGESTYRSGLALQVVNIKSVVNTCGMMLWTALWGFCGNAVRRVYAAHSKIFSVVLAASLVLCAISAL